VPGAGNDTLFGGSRKDYLSGEEGDDTLAVAYLDGRLRDFPSCGLGDDVVIIAGVPTADRGNVRRMLDGVPHHCETIRFAQ
jgi:hypothetical protein